MTSWCIMSYFPGTGFLNTVTGTPSGGSSVEYAKCTKYAPTGKIGKITHTYNNAKTEYTYDAKTTRLATLKTTGPAPGNVTIQNKSYTYYESGDIHTITDKLTVPNITYTYQYDNLHRLKEETTSDTSLPTDADIMTYNYDDSEHINAVTSIIYNGTDYGFTYDDNGNMKDGWDLTDPNSIVERDITWNADNMPVTVTRGSATTDLTYDGDGVRAKKIEVGSTTSTTYYVSNDYEIKDGTPIKYIFAGNLRVAEIEGSTTSIFHKDHLGSSTAMTNSAGTKVEGTEYLPFGGMRSYEGLNVSNYKYSDQEVDNSSNLYNYDARLYDPVIGRFISADTVVPVVFNPQALNRYTYCLNNPLIYVDPTGHYAEIWYYLFEKDKEGRMSVTIYITIEIYGESANEKFASYVKENIEATIKGNYEDPIYGKIRLKTVADVTVRKEKEGKNSKDPDDPTRHQMYVGNNIPRDENGNRRSRGEVGGHNTWVLPGHIGAPSHEIAHNLGVKVDEYLNPKGCENDCIMCDPTNTNSTLKESHDHFLDIRKTRTPYQNRIFVPSEDKLKKYGKQHDHR